MTGPWGQIRCVVTPFDDRSLNTGPHWRRQTGHGYLNGTFLQTHTHGAVARVSHLTRVSAFGLLVATGPRQGRIRAEFIDPDGFVIWNRVLNLHSPQPHKRVVRSALYESNSCCDSGLRGRIVFKVVSRGQPVNVDGVFVVKSPL